MNAEKVDAVDNETESIHKSDQDGTDSYDQDSTDYVDFELPEPYS